MPKLSREQKEQIKKLQKEGVSQRKIAKFLGINRTSVQYNLSENFRKKALERERKHRKNLSPQKKKERSEKQAVYYKRRYHEDEVFRRKEIKKVRTRQKKMNEPKWRTCPFCRERMDIRKEKGWVCSSLSFHALKELRGEYYSPFEDDRKGYRHYHTSCFGALEKSMQRKLRSEDFTHRLLSLDNEVWIEIDESGEEIFKTLFSDLPKIDKELQRIKKKGLKNLNFEEKEWLRGVTK